MITDAQYYEKLADKAFLGVVRNVLLDMEEGLLVPNPALYFVFKTWHSGVMMPSELRDKFPDEMTIVLQHQYEKLEVREDGFSVILSFSGERRRLSIPFSALSSFCDASAKFSLSFTVQEKKPENISHENKLIDLRDLKKSGKK